MRAGEQRDLQVLRVCRKKAYLLGCHMRGNVLQDLKLLGVHADSDLWHHHSHLQPESKPCLKSCVLGGQTVNAIPQFAGTIPYIVRHKSYMGCQVASVQQENRRNGMCLSVDNVHKLNS